MTSAPISDSSLITFETAFSLPGIGWDEKTTASPGMILTFLWTLAAMRDSAAAVLEFESGALGTLQASTTACPGYPRRIEICGEAGSVALEEDSIARWDLPIPCALPVGEAAKNVGAADPKAISNTGHMLQIRNFVDAILRGTPLTADAQTGRTPLEIIMAVYESSRSGKTVFLGGASNA